MGTIYYNLKLRQTHLDQPMKIIDNNMVNGVSKRTSDLCTSPDYATIRRHFTGVIDAMLNSVSNCTSYILTGV
ncbi:unnamed protein product [Macrosiphum euphorbiae]|uniref:Uncharacterized protein n=1 Tax=Macrosiphum euphorbiae TaxID=13131 RepID=A0AAV0XMF2_9HEMI|nr:unnamed protein product [Macrosiphum euphorbiae]